VTVLRDAGIITAPVADLGHDALVEAMTGDVASVSGQAGRRELGEPVLEIEELNGVSLTVRAGEIVGLAGRVGSRAIALGETVVGLRRPQTGRVRMSGVDVPAGSVGASLAAGIGFVPEDRHREGLIPLALHRREHHADRRSRHRGAGRKRDVAATRLMRRLDMKAAGPRQRVSALSGATSRRWSWPGAGQPAQSIGAVAPDGGGGRALQAVTPDRGGGSGRDGQRGADRLRRARRLRVADRVLVMFHGRITAVFDRDWTDAELVAAMEGLGTDAA